MDHGRQSKDSLCYSNLFNLESLMNFQLPQQDDDFDYYGNSSQDESRGSQGGTIMKHGNGPMRERESIKRRKRSENSDDEDEESYYGTRVTEDRYRSMLGEHVQKYKRRVKDSSASPAPTRMGVPLPRSNLGSKARKLGNEHRGGFNEVETISDWLNDINRQKQENYHETDFAPLNGSERTTYEPAFLDIGDGITYKIPPTYDKSAASLNLPSFSDFQVEDFYLKGTLDLGSLAAMMANNKRLGPRSWAGMGEPQLQYESLHARLKALSASKLPHKFSLKVSDIGLHSFIPEGAAGNIKRSILSEGGVLQVYYVKVLEKGDTYEIIERALPKKTKLKKDPSVIEEEEKEKIGKVWVNIVRRDIPKHHRIFTALHRKQLIDAKRFSENCQREVKMKVSRSLKLMRGAAIRTRKLARDMLLYWKRVDKEMAEVRKREEREAAEALRREQELREAKRQQQRLNFLIQQTELYSHFMQKKSNSQPSEALPVGGEKLNDQEVVLSSSDAEPDEEEDLEEAELKKEAFRAAQDAVSKQKKLTSTFDSECSRLRQAAESEVAGASNIDLHNPSTMPVTSTVQTPRMFKGFLKEYQLKGLQWLVNCYEQGLNGILADEMGLGKTIQAMAFLAHLAEEKNIWGPFLVVAPASVLNNWNDEVSRFCPDMKTLPYWGGLQDRTILRKRIKPKDLYRREAGFHILITSYQLLVSDEKYFRRVKWQYMVLDEAQAIKSSNSIRWKTLLSFNCRNRLLLTGTPIQNNMAELWALLHFIMPTLFDSHEQFNEWFSKGIESHAEHGGTLNEHQLNRLHSILKPFMLRRVKTDVVSELTSKTEVTVHCKLSSRQQAFYQAIKNKISLAELFDGHRGHLNEKKILNLMNIVIQLRKVCNHPELFERNEGSTYLHFGKIPNSLLPPPFGELEDIHYAGGHNPITYKIPKLVHLESAHGSETLCLEVGHAVSGESYQKHFNMFSPENVYRSIFLQEDNLNGLSVRSGTFGFTRLMDLSPSEVTFLASGSFMEQLLFSVMRWDRKFLDGIIDLLMETMDDDPECSYLKKGDMRAVTRMLLMPSRSENNLLRSKYATGPADAPFEALVIPHQDRLLYNSRLLHSAYTFIPRIRAPPIDAHCSDRNFAYKMSEELHDPWIKRLFTGFARTSEFNGPRKPDGRPHNLIQEIDSELPVSQPALQLTYKIFGSSPPIRSFDPAKLLTDSGKLQTLDILLKRLRAENHRVLLFAQMTKMLNILEDYMNYRKYRYLRLDGSSTITDRRDMVRDFQHRSDIFVFLLSTRAGGLGINLTAADTVIFYESDWNPTLDLQAMDRAHRLGQTKDVTVYRLICKETVEEKILQRASQKNTVQQLVMMGGHVQGDLLAPEDVVSLLLDDAQLEQKLREIPLQVKDRQKKKNSTKGILVDAEGDASLEDLTNVESQGTGYEPSPDPERAKSSNKKRKAASDKQALPRSRNSQKMTLAMDEELDDSLQNPDLQAQRPKRPKRPTKSVNETLEPAFTGTPTGVSEQTHYPSMSELGSGVFRPEAEQDISKHGDSFP
ncbi:chromatin-remodeling ATPase INO80-like isoform X1 [Juglans microcarpa x Juglans regia]|uniref:chromatin-remodeling ATPase INO80-like isoform X1 n=3 Tax=Juglans microcarpa x Juglans regia TaxID=2249226 RepID=UPI001B7DCA2E|nr:chromatin-remodeling ATPase INO80-like isoform X1 [Juglans microcarpa x Juglans regia]XP_041024465.1 chromatin-remodeling ATPase INO80-like isoform X1 [Juglans microcarpa x Juglans regia]